MRQKFEIEVDVPDGWRIKCQGTRNNIRPTIGPSSCETQIVANLILEKVEPKRESRWCAMPTVAGGYDTADICRRYYPDSRLCRLDYEDGKLVAVTLEPEGEEA